MSYHADPTTYGYSCSPSLSETPERNFQAIPSAVVPVPYQSPVSFYSWDVTPDSGSISASTRSSPEIPSHTITGYNCPHRGDDQPPWRCSIAGHRCDPRSHPPGHPFELTFAPSVGDQRTTRLDQIYPRIGVFEVVYTDDARRKLGEGVRRWCFNCRAVDTSTWRRSSLSQGKLLCNKCGLYERTHRVARPDKFPRKRRARPASAPPVPGYPPSSGGEHWQYHYGHSSTIPSTIPSTQCFQPFDAVGGQPISQSTSWVTQNEASSSSYPAMGDQCYLTSQQQTMYHRRM